MLPERREGGKGKRKNVSRLTLRCGAVEQKEELVFFALGGREEKRRVLKTWREHPAQLASLDAQGKYKPRGRKR